MGSKFISLALIGSWWFSGELLISSLCFLSYLLFICRYFIKEIPSEFPCLDTVMQTFEMLLDFGKAKNSHRAAHVFLCFSQVSQHPACLDHSIQARESTWYFLNLSRHLRMENAFSTQNKKYYHIDAIFYRNHGSWIFHNPNTVKTVFSGHPREIDSCLFNRGVRAMEILEPRPLGY